MRPHPRRARTDPTSPRAWATSDRNGMVGQHQDLRWQYDWAGAQLVNKRILVHADELDKPQRQLGTLVIPADPPGIMNARPEPYSIDETNPAETTLSVLAALGTTILTVTSSTGFTTGNSITVALDDGSIPKFTVTVNSATSLTVSSPLSYSAAADAAVSVVL